MTRAIPVVGGHSALVDDEDFDLLSSRNWHLSGNGYVQSRNGGRTVMMHKMIIDVSEEEQVDHADRNKLNNTKANLRPCSPSQNSSNMGPRGKLIPFKGVIRNLGKKRTTFRARAMKDGVVYQGKTRKSADLAAMDYDRIAKSIHGEFAYLNFPETGNA